MERMGPLDASFWTIEDEHVALHIGGVAVFGGPVPTAEEISRLYRRRLRLLPRYGQIMRSVPLGLDWPEWVDDPDFDLTYHLRRTALPRPGTEEHLFTLMGRIMSQRLDPSRPLWECWVIEGLAEDQWALVMKVHHCMVDGVAGMELFTRLLDPEPVYPPPSRSRRPAPVHAPVRVRVRLAANAVTGRVTEAQQVIGGLLSGSLRPYRTVRSVASGVRGSLGYAQALRSFSSTSLTGPLGTPRRYVGVTADISDIVRIRAAFGGSLNDAVLTIVTHAFRELLISRGESPGPRAVRCLVPVSVRPPAEAHDSANRVSALLVELPVDFANPASAHGAVVARMHQLKAIHEAEAGRLETELAGHLPAPVVTAVLRAVLHVPHHVLTTVTTNVPGPREPVSMLGRPMVAMYPYVPLADRIRVGVAVTSYNDRLYFGITGDRASVPDIGVFTRGLHDGLAELVKAADAAMEETS